MKPLRTLGLGIRLAFVGGRASVVRVALMALGLGLGGLLLLGALAIGPALHRHELRVNASYGIEVAGNRLHASDITLTWLLGSTFEGRSLRVEAFDPTGTRAPLPPGIESFPQPGEVFVSSSLQALLEGPDGPLVRPRVPGRVAGTIGDDGLVYPGELVAFESADRVPAALRKDGEPVLSFVPAGRAAPPPDAGALVLIVLVVVGVLLPIGLFIVTVTRLSSATREARLAAVRLAGATQRQIRVFAGVPAAVAAFAGVAIAAALFPSTRELIARLAPVEGGLFPSDVAPPRWGAAFLFVLLPLFALAVSNVAMRRVIVTPLGIARRARHVRRGWQWPVMFALGLAILWLTAANRDLVMRQPTPEPGVIIGAGLLLMLVGLAGSVPWLGGWVGRHLAERRPSPSLLIGARRLESDPASMGRVVTGITVLIAIVVVVQAIFLSDKLMYGGTAPHGIQALALTDVVVLAYGAKEPLPTLGTIPGVTSVHLSRALPDGARCGRIVCAAVLGTDGDPATVERVRNAVAWNHPYANVETGAEMKAGGSAAGGPAGDDRAVRAIELAILVLLLVTAASVLVSTVDGMMERTRSLAALSAIGVATGVLRRSVLFQVAVPLVLGLTAGLATGAITATLVFWIAREPMTMPTGQMFATAGAMGSLALLVTGASLPWLRITRRPELLRND